LGTGFIDLAELVRLVHVNDDAPIVILEMQYEWASASLPVWQEAVKSDGLTKS